MELEIVEYFYQEQKKYYERKGFYMQRAFNKDLVEGNSRSRRLFENGDTHFDPMPFRYRCQANPDGFTIVFEKLESEQLYAKIVKFIGFDEVFESDWKPQVNHSYSLENFEIQPVEIFAKEPEQEKPIDDDACIFAEIKERFAEANLTAIKSPTSNKHLIYFTLGFNEEFVKMVKCCIRSIIVNASVINFDILILHDPKVDVSQFHQLFPEISFHFLELPEARDGVEASMNKLKIFSFDQIWKYSKVLFLDADIIFGKIDLKDVFEMRLKYDTFYSTIHESCHIATHQTFFHTIRQYTKDEMEKFKENNLKPFNAGQFMFRVSSLMQEHFENVLHLVSIWKKNYFFEQAFLNYYFNSNLASDTETMRKYFSIYYIGKNHMNELTLDKSKIVHYAGNPCDSQTKLDFVKEHFKEYL